MSNCGISGAPCGESNRRVAVIGLDGMPWHFLLNIEKRKPLNFIRRAITDGACGTLIAWPPLTPISWTSIFTGVNPAKHGIFGFKKVYKVGNKLSARFYNAYDVRYPRITEMLSLLGHKTISICIPLTYPLQAIYKKSDDIIVSDPYSPDLAIHPEYVRKNHPTAFQRLLAARKLKEESTISNIVDNFEKLVNGIKRLVDDVEWDFLAIVFNEFDWVLHELGSKDILRGYNESFAQLTVIIDDFLENISKNIDLLIITSDHGFYSYGKHVNPLSILISEGVLKNPTSLTLELLKALGKLVYGNKVLATANPLLSILYRMLVKDEENAEHRRVHAGSNKVYWEDVDEADTPILYFSNVLLRDYALKTLSKLKYRGYFKVRKFEEVFWGTEINDIPPALVLFPNLSDGIYLSPHDHEFVANLPLFYKLENHHHPYGIFIAYGKNVNKNFLNAINPYDIVPTILSFLKLPIPSDTDGKVLRISNDIDIRRKTKLNYKKLYFREKLRQRLRMKKRLVERTERGIHSI